MILVTALSPNWMTISRMLCSFWAQHMWNSSLDPNVLGLVADTEVYWTFFGVKTKDFPVISLPEEACEECSFAWRGMWRMLIAWRGTQRMLIAWRGTWRILIAWRGMSIIPNNLLFRSCLKRPKLLCDCLKRHTKNAKWSFLLIVPEEAHTVMSSITWRGMQTTLIDLISIMPEEACTSMLCLKRLKLHDRCFVSFDAKQTNWTSVVTSFNVKNEELWVLSCTKLLFSLRPTLENE